jgi:hypothetical protein
MYKNVGQPTTTDIRASKPLANNQKNLERWGLPEEVRLMLLDWCAANYGGSATDVISEALTEHIERRKADEPEMAKRFKAARDRRVGGTKPKVVSITPGSDAS